MRIVIALLTLASFGATFAVAQTADSTNTTTKTKKHSKKKESKKKPADQTHAAAPTK